MCTSIISNRKKTIVGWNLDILDMEYRVTESSHGVFIEINDAKEGYMPLFGVNNRGDFVGMPTCWPYDTRSEPDGKKENIIMLDIDLLTKKRTFEQIRAVAESGDVCSVEGITFMSALSDKDGNVLHIVPGQGASYYKKPMYKVLTNFSPYKGDSEKHSWMGLDRYNTAQKMLQSASDDFDVSDCFAVLKATSQEICPTVVSMVFDASRMKVYWCENRNWDTVHERTF